MTTQLIHLLESLTGLLAGGLIGVGFGLIQDAARRRNERLQQAGKLRSAWTVVPGSGRRVAYLLIVLVLVQVVCPLLFREALKWWVSAGVGLGYGAMLFRQLRHRLAQYR
jgi:hypothetical protein